MFATINDYNECTKFSHTPIKIIINILSIVMIKPVLDNSKYIYIIMSSGDYIKSTQENIDTINTAIEKQIRC